MCLPQLEFQLVNPTTQVALFTACRGSCASLINVTWHVYQGSNRTSTSIQWTLFNQVQQYENIWFFGTA